MTATTSSPAQGRHPAGLHLCRPARSRAVDPASQPGSRTTGNARQRRRVCRHFSFDLHLSWSRARRCVTGSPRLYFFPINPMSTPALRDTVTIDVLVPLAANNGALFPEEVFHAFERRVVALTGGITRRGDVEGIWRTPSGDLQRERSRAYSTTVDSARAERVAVELDVLLQSLFGQLAAYVQATPTRATAF